MGLICVGQWDVWDSTPHYAPRTTHPVLLTHQQISKLPICTFLAFGLPITQLTIILLNLFFLLFKKSAFFRKGYHHETDLSTT